MVFPIGSNLIAEVNHNRHAPRTVPLNLLSFASACSAEKIYPAGNVALREASSDSNASTTCSCWRFFRAAGVLASLVATARAIVEASTSRHMSCGTCASDTILEILMFAITCTTGFWPGEHCVNRICHQYKQNIEKLVAPMQSGTSGWAGAGLRGRGKSRKGSNLRLKNSKAQN